MEFIKENLITILLVSLIIIILIILGIFLLKTSTKDENSGKLAASEIKEIIPNDDVEKEETSDTTIIEDNYNTIQENDSKLVQIVNTFNSSNTAEQLRLQGYTLNAAILQDGITVFSSGEGLTFNIQFVLNNNILSTEIMYNHADSRITTIEMLLAIILIDSVGQNKGFPEQTLSTALAQQAAMNYTIENEGVEIKKLDNEQGVAIRVDLNSDFSFLNI